MPASLVKILIVEDREYEQSYFAQVLSSSGIDIIAARSLREAEELFRANQDVALVVMDGAVDNERELDSVPLVKELRKEFGFAGPIIAASSDKSFRGILMNAGCDYQATKSEVPWMILSVLGLTSS